MKLAETTQPCCAAGGAAQLFNQIQNRNLKTEVTIRQKKLQEDCGLITIVQSEPRLTQHGAQD